MELQTYLKTKSQEKDIAFMAHIICGYPSLEDNWNILTQLDRAGVEIVEFQFPFSEPIADGASFLKANEESLKNGTKKFGLL